MRPSFLTASHIGRNVVDRGYFEERLLRGTDGRERACQFFPRGATGLHTPQGNIVER